MEVLIAPGAGFCFGVRRAVQLADKTIAAAPGRISTLGPLIHNPTVVRSLAARGVRTVNSPVEAGSGTLIIRSHGALPEEIAEAKRLGLKVIDATCPFVRKAQRLAVRLARAGYQVVVVGDPAHPEIRAVSAMAGAALVVAEVGDLEMAQLKQRVGLVCQTTLTPEVLSRVAAAIAPACRELVVHNTICTATYERQRAALDLARRVDALVVLGGHESANTARLAEVCRQVTPTFHVEDPSELDPQWFAGCGKVGLTAGASTPIEQIVLVQERLEEMAQEGKV